MIYLNIYNKEERARAVQYLVRVRYQKNLTQVQVCERFDLHPSILTRYETGKLTPHRRVFGSGLKHLA